MQLKTRDARLPRMNEQKYFFTRRLIEAAIATTGALVSRWRSEESHALISELGKKFCSGELDWEAFVVERASKPRDYGKADVCNFVDGHLCLLVTKEGDVFEAKNGDHLRLVFDETPRFEFYVCDGEMTYLLCLNHHDYLIGCGTSIPFVDKLWQRVVPSQ